MRAIERAGPAQPGALGQRAHEPSLPAENVATTTFSFVIPAYNERDDIEATIDSCLAQRLPPNEIIVVDGGSSDGTRELLRARAERDGIIAIEEERRRGVAAARNIGMRAATADVVVILNADVIPGPDFTERLGALYRDGADYVSVQSRVANMDCVIGRYISASHAVRYPEHRVGWTEGFSCRRELALQAQFPDELPGLGGEDVVFFQRLRVLSPNWRVDYSIVVPHRVPALLGGFADQQRWRGNAIPYIDTRMQGMSLIRTTARRALVAAKSLLLTMGLVPNAIGALRLASRSPNGLRDLYAFWLLRHVQEFAHRRGEWQTIVRLIRERGGA